MGCVDEDQSIFVPLVNRPPGYQLPEFDVPGFAVTRPDSPEYGVQHGRKVRRGIFQGHVRLDRASKI